MLNVDRRTVFQARLGGKELDLGKLNPAKDDYDAILAEMKEIGLLKPIEILNTAYKVNLSFYFDGINADGEEVEQEFKLGQTIGLSDDGTFTFKDCAGDVFVAEITEANESEQEEEEEEKD